MICCIETLSMVIAEYANRRMRYAQNAFRTQRISHLAIAVIIDYHGYLSKIY